MNAAALHSEREREPPELRPGESTLSRLRGEEHAMLAAIGQVADALVHGTLGERPLRAVDEGMRELRALLPRHLVVAEQVLYPEVEAAVPEAGDRLRGLVLLHHAAEEALSRLQAACLALAVDPASVGARRRAARGARDLRATLEALVQGAEAGPFTLADRRLDADAWARIEAAAAAASLREARKAAERR